MKPGTLFFGGVVETMRPDRGPVNSLAYRGGAILAVGNNLESDSDFSNFRKVNLHGAALYPGFVDAHTHFCYYALSLDHINLSGVASLPEALKKIKVHTENIVSQNWIVGGGLQVELFTERRWPAAADLDSVSSVRPAVIYSHDQHSLWVNSEALRRAKITRRTPDPAGGRIERGSDGTPSGILRENAAYDVVLKLIPELTGAEKKKLYARALKSAYANGVTGVHSFDTGSRFDFLVERANAGKLGLRVNFYINTSDLERASRVLGQAPAYGFGDDFFRIAGVKFFADGSLGSKTALLHQPYSKSRGSCGVAVKSHTDLTVLARRAQKLGLPCAIHAIGDRAVTNVIRALAKVAPPCGARHRIEHVQMVRRTDIPALKRLRAVASMQPQQLPGDVESIHELWGARARNCYLFRTMIEKGIPLAFGSDVPIEPLDPLAGIRDAVYRRSRISRRILNPPERITALQAARAFTAGPAFAAGEGRYSGALLPGYRADLVILSGNPRGISRKQLSELHIAATILNGKCVYSDGALDLDS